MGKSRSNRTPQAAKHSKQKKTSEAKRNMKRYGRDNPHLVGSMKKKQDVGIPDLVAFKARMLDGAKNERLEAAERKQREREFKVAQREKELRRHEQEQQHQKKDYEHANTTEGRRKWYFKELMRLIEASDVILEVLDARDPIGCRATDIEKKILAMQDKEGRPTKRLVLVLNKIDMVPPEIVLEWVHYLRREFPTLAFKASTQRGNGYLASIDNINVNKNTTSAVNSQSAVGASHLLQLIKNYSRHDKSKTGLTVGVIGYPNVGKSSIINSLKSQRVAQVSAMAGCTTSLQQIRLDSNITLIDSPGVLFDADYNPHDTESTEKHHGLLLRNVLRVDQIVDPTEAVKAILTRCTKEQLMTLYEVAEFHTLDEFLLFVAHRKGKLLRGGIPNFEDTARSIIQDWNSGKIPFYVTPPQVNDVQQSTIVSSFSDEFDINKLLDDSNNNAVKVIKVVQDEERARGQAHHATSGGGYMDEMDGTSLLNGGADDDDDENDYEFGSFYNSDEGEDGMGDDDDGEEDSGIMGLPQHDNGSNDDDDDEEADIEEVDTRNYGFTGKKNKEHHTTTADRLTAQQKFHKQQKTASSIPSTAAGSALPLRSRTAGRSKAATVLSAQFEQQVLGRAKTKAELKKQARKEKRAKLAAAQQYDSDDDDEY